MKKKLTVLTLAMMILLAPAFGADRYLGLTTGFQTKMVCWFENGKAKVDPYFTVPVKLSYTVMFDGIFFGLKTSVGEETWIGGEAFDTMPMGSFSVSFLPQGRLSDMVRFYGGAGISVMGRKTSAAKGEENWMRKPNLVFLNTYADLGVMLDLTPHFNLEFEVRPGIDVFTFREDRAEYLPMVTVPVEITCSYRF